MAEIDFDDDDLDLEEEGGPDDSAAEGEKDKPSGFFSKKRVFLILGILVVVFGIGAGFFFLSTRKEGAPTASPAQGATTRGAAQGQAAQTQTATEAVSPAAPIAPRVHRDDQKDKKIKYDMIFQSLTPDQTSSVLRELSLQKVPFKTESNGKNFDVFVDRDMINFAKNMLAVRGLPASGARGYQLLDDQQTLGVTEFDKRIRFLRALSGELELAIMQFDAIESAKVQIVLPEQRLFAVTQPPVTASILIRGVPRVTLSDDIVFSIIQLVSNAVENLQPENVSVIDTDGRVLSEGIFERMAAQEQAAETPVAPTPETAEAAPPEKIGQPIIPDFEALKNWMTIKSKYEQELIKRAMRQMLGLLPAGSYKIMVNAEIGAVDKGKVLDVRRLTSSIVIDNSNDTVYVDDVLRQQIYSTIAGATGYVRGRDRIDLSYADFSLLSEKDRKEILKYLPKNRPWLTALLKVWPYGMGGLLVVGALVWGIRRFRRPKKTPFSLSESSRENGIDGLHQDLTQEKYIDNIRATAAQNPKVVAGIFQDWLKGEV